jgi:hypothetical protein
MMGETLFIMAEISLADDDISRNGTNSRSAENQERSTKCSTLKFPIRKDSQFLKYIPL